MDKQILAQCKTELKTLWRELNCYSRPNENNKTIIDLDETGQATINKYNELVIAVNNLDSDTSKTAVDICLNKRHELVECYAGFIKAHPDLLNSFTDTVVVHKIKTLRDLFKGLYIE